VEGNDEAVTNEPQALARAARMLKEARLATPLQPHQERVVEKIKRPDQPGLVVAHGLGSGKTLTSIAAQDALGLPSQVVVPAALQANYRKEIKKHVRGKHPEAKIVSMQNVARKGEGPAAPLMIVDEAHRARETGSKTFETLKKNKAQKRLLLTGTPFYNRPSDIAPLVNIAAGGKVLPEDRQDFEDRYIFHLRKNPGFLARMRGVRSGSVPIVNPARRKELQATLNKWVDYYEGSKENFPEVESQEMKVPMTQRQLEFYDTLMKKAPFWVRYKVKKGLPPTKQEAGDLNAFLGGVRQVSNATAPFQLGGEPEAPKVQKAFEELKKNLDANPRAKAVVYSNYLQAGIDPYKKKLTEAGIPYGEFSGQMKKKERDALVKAYNDNKIRALLLSSAGGEGLDLKGTRLMQVLEPHWNEEKIRQVIGRGVRYGSHADLPPEERKVLVQRFLATRPRTGMLERMGLRSQGLGVDEYLTRLSQDKDRLNTQFRELLRQEDRKKK
jgi:SNF2 family DNA or RNA helicase